ncbi:hypothetical protein [Candidatus Palauibacter sp.]|uniref:hypothetical protein n=1 Tax=Candidatus Palauibacter sp. TaxID=3101350 RepID=UPI003B028668
MGAIATEIAHEARDTLGDPETAEAARGLDTTERPDVALGTLLRLWTKADAAPLVLLIDEIDALVGDSLVSVLRQLRAGYAHRPARSLTAPCCAGCGTCATTGSTRVPRGR